MFRLNLLRVLLLLFLAAPFSGYSQYKKESWESRDTWQKVPELIRLMDVEKGMAVADIGCHEGYMTIHLSDFLGDEGKVYAVDIVQHRIDTLKKLLKDEKRSNVAPILGREDDPLLPDNTLDAVIIMDTYHEIDSGKKVLKKVYTSLKKQGRILILEEINTFRIKESRSNQTAWHDIALRYVKEDLEAVGFVIEKEIPDFGRWEDKEDEQMWILVAVKK